MGQECFSNVSNQPVMAIISPDITPLKRSTTSIEHCDGMYATPDYKERSHLTLQLYLNGGPAPTPPTFPSHAHTPTTKSRFHVLTEAITTALTPSPPMEEGGEMQGGATRFWGQGTNNKSWVDVEPRTGRVLIFQQRGLIHSGEEVKGGVKVCVRTDLMYVREDE